MSYERQLARRAARRRPRRPVGLGARRGSLDRLGACGRRARRSGCWRRSVGSLARRGVSCARRPTRSSGSRGSTETGSTPRRRALLERCVIQLEARVQRGASRTVALVRGPPGVRQRSAPARADRRRRGARARRPVRGRARVARWLGDECGLADGLAPASRPSGPPPRRARARRGRRAAARRLGLRRGRAGRVRGHRTSRSTAPARSGRSSGSWGATGSACRSTTSRPAAAATGSATSALNANEGAESTLAFHRAQLVLDAAGLRRVVRRASRGYRQFPRERQRRQRAPGQRELFRRHPGNPILTAADWP